MKEIVIYEPQVLEYFPAGIIRPVVFVSALSWFIRYIYNWHEQFLNNVIINKTKVLSLMHRWP